MKNTKTIKKEIALFLLAGYETVEAIVKGLIKYRTLALAFALIYLIVMITVCKIMPSVEVALTFTFKFMKFLIPTGLLSATTLRYLLG